MFQVRIMKSPSEAIELFSVRCLWLWNVLKSDRLPRLSLSLFMIFGRKK